MSTLYIPIGIPGCGKTTYGDSLENTEVLSSDKIRGEFFGDEAIQDDDDFAKQWAESHNLHIPQKSDQNYHREIHKICNNAVFDTLFERAQNALTDGKDVYYDATNLYSSRRESLLERFDDYDKAVAVFFDIPYNICKERNKSRDRTVPENVLENMAENLEYPTFEEGFQEIRVIRPENEKIYTTTTDDDVKRYGEDVLKDMGLLIPDSSEKNNEPEK